MMSGEFERERKDTRGMGGGRWRDLNNVNTASGMKSLKMY